MKLRIQIVNFMSDMIGSKRFKSSRRSHSAHRSLMGKYLTITPKVFKLPITNPVKNYPVVTFSQLRFIFLQFFIFFQRKNVKFLVFSVFPLWGIKKLKNK